MVKRDYFQHINIKKNIELTYIPLTEYALAQPGIIYKNVELTPTFYTRYDDDKHFALFARNTKKDASFNLNKSEYLRSLLNVLIPENYRKRSYVAGVFFTNYIDKGENFLPKCTPNLMMNALTRDVDIFIISNNEYFEDKFKDIREKKRKILDHLKNVKETNIDFFQEAWDEQCSFSLAHDTQFLICIHKMNN